MNRSGAMKGRLIAAVFLPSLAGYLFEELFITVHNGALEGLSSQPGSHHSLIVLLPILGNHQFDGESFAQALFAGVFLHLSEHPRPSELAVFFF